MLLSCIILCMPGDLTDQILRTTVSKSDNHIKLSPLLRKKDQILAPGLFLFTGKKGHTSMQ